VSCSGVALRCEWRDRWGPRRKSAAAKEQLGNFQLPLIIPLFFHPPIFIIKSFSRKSLPFYSELKSLRFLFMSCFSVGRAANAANAAQAANPAARRCCCCD